MTERHPLTGIFGFKSPLPAAHSALGEMIVYTVGIGVIVGGALLIAYENGRVGGELKGFRQGWDECRKNREKQEEVRL